MKNLKTIGELLLVLCFTLKVVYVKSGTEIPVGFPCEQIPNFCDRVTCAPPKNCQNGIIVKGAGNCGCCDACITYREIGENCSDVAKVPAKLPDGVIAQYFSYDTCYPGLQCNNHLCQAFSTEATSSPGFKECTYHEYECKQHQWEEKPTCDFYGDYSEKSCKGSSNPRCFCVDTSGNTIFGSLSQDKAQNATCACSRAVSTTQKPLADFLRCDQTGDFVPLQCWGEVCFCVDPYKKIMTSEAVPIAGIMALPCWDSKLYNASYYTPCTTEFMRQSGIAKEQYMKGMTIDPLDLPNCDPDGTYGFKQYDSNAYFCSDREGLQIASYATTDYSVYEGMICNCARDDKYSAELPDNNRGRTCDPQGNYVRKYCNQAKCFCLDTDGQQSSDTFDPNPDIDCVKTLPPASSFQMDESWTSNLWTEQDN